jgi:hypothetical protein
MFYVVYATRGGNLSVKHIPVIYLETAISKCARLRHAYGWQAYRLFFDDGKRALQVAQWDSGNYSWEAS